MSKIDTYISNKNTLTRAFDEALTQDPFSLEYAITCFDFLFDYVKLNGPAGDIHTVTLPVHSEHYHYTLLSRIIDQLDSLPFRDFAFREANQPSPVGSLEPSAFEQSFVALFEHLLSRGIDPNGYEANKQTPLHFAVGREKCFLIPVLLQHGANVNAPDEQGETPLMDSVKKNFEEVFALMQKYGGDVSYVSKSQESFFHMVARSGSLNMATELLTLLPLDSLNTHNHERLTPFHISISKRHDEMTRLFLDHGASLLICDGRGNTPMHLAHTHKPLLELLIEQGASPFLLNHNGQTPLNLAKHNPDCRVYLEGVMQALRDQKTIKQVLSFKNQKASLGTHSADLNSNISSESAPSLGTPVIKKRL